MIWLPLLSGIPRSDIKSYCDLFLVPGCDEKKMNKAPNLKVDTIVLDLEDGVALNRKTAAREMVFSALEVFVSRYALVSVPLLDRIKKVRMLN